VECPECHSMVPALAKFCPECGTRLIASGSEAKIQDSVVTRSPGAGSSYAPVINISSKEQKNLRCTNCDMEITKDNKPLICMECGVKFCENCEGFYRHELRQRGEKPLCYKCYTAATEEWAKEKKKAEDKAKAEEEAKATAEEEAKAKAEEEAKAKGVSLIEAAKGNFEKGKYEEALIQLNEALKIDSNNSRAYKTKGLIYYYQGKMDEAEREYKEAIRIDPNDVDAHNSLVIIYNKRVKLNQAKIEVRRFNVGIWEPVTITIPMEAGLVLEGSLRVSGGNNDIYFYIKDQLNNILLKKKMIENSYDFSITALIPGPFYIYFDNKHSIRTNKEVSLSYRIL
jgi:tetratricopeptide (TPR) repeat protein